MTWFSIFFCGNDVKYVDHILKGLSHEIDLAFDDM